MIVESAIFSFPERDFWVGMDEKGGYAP